MQEQSGNRKTLKQMSCKVISVRYLKSNPSSLFEPTWSLKIPITFSTCFTNNYSSMLWLLGPHVHFQNYLFPIVIFLVLVYIPPLHLHFSHNYLQSKQFANRSDLFTIQINFYSSKLFHKTSKNLLLPSYLLYTNLEWSESPSIKAKSIFIVSANRFRSNQKENPVKIPGTPMFLLSLN